MLCTGGGHQRPGEPGADTVTATALALRRLADRQAIEEMPSVPKQWAGPLQSRDIVIRGDTLST